MYTPLWLTLLSASTFLCKSIIIPCCLVRCGYILRLSHLYICVFVGISLLGLFLSMLFILLLTSILLFIFSVILSLFLYLIHFNMFYNRNTE